MKRVFFLLLAAMSLLSMTACGGQEPPPPDAGPAKETVELTVWGAEEDTALMEEILSFF